ncbi:MAG: protein-glutamate O-methyltransferase CheR [Desulfuromonadaceae bacterium]|nr:protein-glutamate O-methyltransferase CheR [Desulfuromonadaceae bacterium]
MTKQSAGSEPLVGSEFPDDAFAEIRALLLARRDLDLDMYKDRCLKRRIATRIRRCGFHEATPYIALLHQSEQEVDSLVEALMIHVSQFFRNPSTFILLEEKILPLLINKLHAFGRSEINIWSVGCAGGEEPYSLALLLDNLDRKGLEVKILATDLSDDIIRQASQGRYEEQRLAEVPPEILARYFVKEDRHFHLAKRIRKMVTFRQHNILGKDLFPDCDMIMCRNVMIYFSRDEQENVFRRFAKALNPEGYLILGRAETLQGNTRRLFTVDSPAERIYRRTLAEAY